MEKDNNLKGEYKQKKKNKGSGNLYVASALLASEGVYHAPQGAESRKGFASNGSRGWPPFSMLIFGLCRWDLGPSSPDA